MEPMPGDSEKHTPETDLQGHDPLEVLRRMLAISPEDAEAARSDASDSAPKPAAGDQLS